MVIGRFRNAENVRALIAAIRSKGKTCYDFTAKPADPHHPDAPFAEQMKVLESHPDFLHDPVHRSHYEKDLAGLRNANAIVLLARPRISKPGLPLDWAKNLFLSANPTNLKRFILFSMNTSKLLTIFWQLSECLLHSIYWEFRKSKAG